MKRHKKLLKKSFGHSHTPPKNSNVYFSQVSSLLFQAKCGICGQDTMEGFRGGIRVGELLLAGLVPKRTMFLFHLFFWFSHLKTPLARSPVLIVFLCQDSESRRR